MDNYKHPKSGKTYISPSLAAFGQSDRKVRIASKVIESPESYAFATVKAETVLRHKEGAKTFIKARFFEDDRRIAVLNVQGYTVATEKPHNASFAFIGDEISKLLEFVANIHSYAFKGKGSVNITDAELRRISLSNQQAKTLVEDNEELFAAALRASVTKEDIIAVGYRKKQLQVFKDLLENDDYFKTLTARKGCSDEALWQQFFERNPWIFGYGLNYLYLSTLDDKKLEQAVQGFSVAGRGKRVDALLRSKGIISSLCFVEIKTHKTPLLGAAAYRAACWPPHSELAGAVSQVQGTVAAATDTIRGKLELKDDAGFPTGEEIFNYAPKSYLVIGNLAEFLGQNGVNQEQLRSFELFRRNTASPEIITFDELFERAKFIVRASER
jgi:hypothetical protein